MRRRPVIVMTVRLGAVTAAGWLAACGAQAGAVVRDEAPPSALTVDLSFAGEGTPQLTAHCAVKNVSAQPVQLFDSPRMPYLINDRGTLVVLHGVSPPPEDRDLNAIEIPTTRALAPGDSVAFDVRLAPLHLRSHYGAEPPDPALHGATAIVCRVAHGATPIDEAARAHTAISALLAWQQFEASPTLVVRLP